MTNREQMQAVIALAVVAVSEAMFRKHIAGCECEGGPQRHKESRIIRF